MQQTSVTVQVAGQVFHLRGSDNEEYIKKVAAYLQNAIDTVQEKHPALSTNNCTILGALNITEELFQLRQQYEELDRRIDELRQLSIPQSTIHKGVKTPIKHPFEESIPSKK